MKIPALIAALGLVAIAAGLLLRRNDSDDTALDDGRAEKDDLRCKRNPLFGKERNAGYCECEKLYRGVNPVLEQSCKNGVSVRGRAFGSKDLFEATLGATTLAAQTASGQQQIAQQQQLQATQSQLLKEATTPSASSGGNTTLWIAVGVGVLLLVGAAIWKFIK
jgi:hypothetical protein